MTLVIAVALRGRGAAWTIALAAVLPPPAVAVFSTQFNFVGWHVFMHVAPIYQIMERGLGVPEEPLYAGAPMRYPWVEHWLIAKLALLTGANPITQTLIFETLGYVGFLAAAAWLASSFTSDRVTIALAALLSAFGISIFHMSLFTEPLEQAFPPLWLDARVVPLDKFLNISAMPLGYAAMAGSAAAAIRLGSGRGEPRRLAALIAACTFFAALVHPLSWLGILVYGGVAVAVGVIVRRSADLGRVGLVALAVGGPSVLALPYLRLVGAAESSDGWSGVTPSIGLFGAKLANLGFFLAPFLFAAYLHRTELRRLVRVRDRPTVQLLLSVGVFAIAYLLVRMPGQNEYKFLLHMIPAAAVLMALSLRERLTSHPVPALLFLFLLLIPGGRILGLRPWFIVTNPARLGGQYLRSLDPVADGLFQWVGENTPKDAVFLAADLRMPAFGRRTLYVAVDAPWAGRDGWGLPRDSLLQWHVRRPDREMYRRQSLATIVLNPDWAEPPETVMAAIQTDMGSRAIFAHTTSPAVIEKLDRTPGFSRVFTNGAGSIHAFAPARR
jgi:hypothetical protein